MACREVVLKGRGWLRQPSLSVLLCNVTRDYIMADRRVNAGK